MYESHGKKDKKVQNYFVYLKIQKQEHYGKIIRFYDLDGSHYALIEKYVPTRDLLDDFDYELEDFKVKFNNFFAVCRPSNELVAVKLQQIITKCVSIENEDEVFLSPAVSLIEHD